MSQTPCYKSRASHCIGGIFINHDGSRRVVSDNALINASLLAGSTLLCLIYSNCVIGITGYRLDPIFNDVIGGRLGTVTVAVSADDTEAISSDNSPFVTGIIHTPMSALAAFKLGRSDA